MIGLTIIETVHAVSTTEDWSRVRSPARAARRRRRGFPQRIITTSTPTAYQVGEVLYAHPILANELRRRVNER